jgi:protoheme IX farnesyltransferase
VTPTPAHPNVASLDVPVDRASSHSRAADFVMLTKPRLNMLVLITTVVAFWLGAGVDLDAATLLHTILGTALVAGGASALNQVWERRTDKLMRRTRRRPLPDLRLQPAEAAWFGIALTVAGCLWLWFGANPLASGVALLTMISYVLCYTPLKLRTSLSTIVGAVPGALPAVIGWAAATNTLSVEGWVLFAIVFMWQMPHFLAIAWMYRDDYAQAGIPLLPVIEPDGRSTGRQAVLYSVALVPITLLPTLVDLSGPHYLAGAIVLGAILVWLSVEFAATRTIVAARRLFFASILYLPLLWIVLLADHFSR